MTAVMPDIRILNIPIIRNHFFKKRRKARDQNLFKLFLDLSPMAQQYYRKMEQRRLNLHHHVQKIVALSGIYGSDTVAEAMTDAFQFQAFSSEYIKGVTLKGSNLLLTFV